MFLENLEGTNGKKRKCTFVPSVTAMIAAIRSRRVAMAAGDDGAISAYRRDDSGHRYSVVRYEHLCLRDQQIVFNQKRLRIWWQEALKKIRRDDHAY